ncbi:flagellar basal body P-ring formation chaperone FlgA [Pseudidiomarina sp.]|uniref:flagellar basal body P-ring formation chaperone FlgA n=1 Tax=Pseudidiomarina sp. TaxID=2081707 RepID=UPI00299E0734|nr:flagellar basal body P-ring formation chaperone FlgA [Pseudidiomarina sp.]MDX1705779.1 flagellar basal body P-ring formation chaperone FlgA [Pseudidiomarina sp.]
MRTLALLLLLACLPTAVAAAPSQPAEEPWLVAVRQAIAERIPADYVAHEVSLLSNDRTLNLLTGCHKPLAFLNHIPEQMVGRLVVSVTCADRSRQHLVQIEVDATVDYLVAARDLMQGEKLQQADVSVQRGQLSDLPRHAMLASEPLRGQQLRRNLSAGTPLQGTLLEKPRLVSFGDPVTITAAGNGFSIQRTGKSLDTGAAGDIIRVKVDNRLVLRVEVTGPRQARPVSAGQ